MINPLLVFAKSVEAVRSSVKKIIRKNTGVAAKVFGSTKKIIKAIKPERTSMIDSVGKKFLRILIFFWRISFLIPIHFKAKQW